MLLEQRVVGLGKVWVARVAVTARADWKGRRRGPGGGGHGWRLQNVRVPVPVRPKTPPPRPTTAADVEVDVLGANINGGDQIALLGGEPAASAARRAALKVGAGGIVTGSAANQLALLVVRLHVLRAVLAPDEREMARLLVVLDAVRSVAGLGRAGGEWMVVGMRGWGHVKVAARKCAVCRGPGCCALPRHLSLPPAHPPTASPTLAPAAAAATAALANHCERLLRWLLPPLPLLLATTLTARAAAGARGLAAAATARRVCEVAVRSIAVQ